MKLWIRSQDKKFLVNATDIKIEEKDKHRDLTLEDIKNYRDLERSDYVIKQFYQNGGYTELGTYKSRKRALKVLDEIQENLLYTELTIFNMPKE